MDKPAFEYKSLAYIILIGYGFNLLLGWVGFFCIYGSTTQILLYQIGNAFAITASVMAGRYIGLRGEQVAASACILLGITHGISLAAISTTGINPDREVTMAMPMIPALIFMFWCSLYPMWLRISGIIPIILFASVYTHVHLGDSNFGWTLYSGYATLQVIELIWGIFIYLDWKQQIKH